MQLGFGHKKRLNEPEKGHLKASGAQSRHLRDMKTEDGDAYTVGQTLDASIFAVGDLIDVTGTSKGKGFQGVVKRHGFSGGPKTHGQSDRWRAPGSIGATTTPGRVFKGTRMAGHMGDERVTVQNLEVVRVDTERNLLLVKGSVPGATNGFLLVRRSIKAPPTERRRARSIVGGSRAVAAMPRRSAMSTRGTRSGFTTNDRRLSTTEERRCRWIT